MGFPRTLAAAFLAAACSFPAVSWAGPGEGGGASTEAVIAGTEYSFGVLGGYGVEIGDPPELDFIQVLPYVSFPVTGVVGESFYKGVFEYKVEAALALIDNWNNRVEAGFSPVGLRYNFTTLDGFAPYVEGLLGAVYINIPKSIQGTRFNFIESLGVGARYFVTDKTAVDLQVRYRHLSNAGIRKPNPGINTVYALVGFSFY